MIHNNVISTRNIGIVIVAIAVLIGITATPACAIQQADMASTKDTDPTLKVFVPMLVSPEPEPPFIGGFVGSFASENLVYLMYDDPESATWVLLNRASAEVQNSQLDGASIEVTINGSKVATISDAIAQIDTYGGVLVDYDESLFETDSLSVVMTIVNSAGYAIHRQTRKVPNWYKKGVFSLPVERQYLGEDGPLVVYHLDDMLPGEETRSSFNGIVKESVFSNGFVVPGVGQNHGNAIDIGYKYFAQTENYPVFLTASSSLDLYKISSGTNSCGMTEHKIRFRLPFPALTLKQGGVDTYPLLLEFHHLLSVNSELPHGGTILAGTLLGNMGRNGYKADGECGGEIHIGVYGLKGPDPWGPPSNPDSLRLPFAIFISPGDKNFVIDTWFN